jgi:hypothetical protein
MSKESNQLEEVVLTAVLRLNAAIHGVVTGLVVGLAIFVATNWLILKGGDVVGPHLALLGHYLIGYRVTFVGSLIGFVYGFVGGFLGGYLVARMYNSLANRREAKRARPG